MPKKLKVFSATFSRKGEFRFFAENKELARDHAQYIAHIDEGDLGGFGALIGDVRFVGFTTDGTQTDVLK
jgi:hypothetical protein